MFAFSYGFCQCLEDQGQQNNKSEEYFSKFPTSYGSDITYHHILARSEIRALVAQRVKHLPAVRETRFNPCVRKIP